MKRRVRKYCPAAVSQGVVLSTEGDLRPVSQKLTTPALLTAVLDNAR
jgi:hypothetical protein